MEDRLLSLLGQFISFRTVAGNDVQKTECLDWIETSFCSNWPHQRLRGDVNGTPYLYLEHPEATWLWFAHMDVIPGTEEQFTMQTNGDHAIGRGVKDMKGAALPFLMALSDQLEAGTVPRASVLLTSDEEIAGPTIPTLLENGTVSAPAAFTPDTGSTPWIVTEHKGVVWAELTATGKGCHAALPWEGKNPVCLLGKALSQLEAAFPAGSDEDWQLTVSPAQLSGSDARNKVPDAVSCSLDIRYPPEEYQSAETAVAAVSQHLPEGCEVRVNLSADPLYTDPDHPFVRTIQAVASAVLKTDVPVGKEHGATDSRYFSAHGIPACLYGPDGGGIHGCDEWVSIPSLLEHYEISQQLLNKL